MTPQEEQLLNSLVERINQTQLQEKDPDAEALLNQKLGPNPDSLYILTQTVLVQNIALDQARAQVTQLQQQLQQQQSQPAHASSFLGRLLGEHEPAAAQQQQAPPFRPVPQYVAPAPQYAQPQYQQPQYVPIGRGQPSFLRGAMQTAAGVAAGALAFEGVESILHGFGGHGGYGWGGPGMGGFGGGLDRPVEETVVNNYYDGPGARGAEHAGGAEHFHDSADQFANPGASSQDLSGRDFSSRDVSNQGGAQISDASHNTQGDLDTAGSGDASNYDVPSDLDNSDFNDASGYDDSGSFDNGGGNDGGGGDFF